MCGETLGCPFWLSVSLLSFPSLPVGIKYLTPLLSFWTSFLLCSLASYLTWSPKAIIPKLSSRCHPSTHSSLFHFNILPNPKTGWTPSYTIITNWNHALDSRVLLIMAKMLASKSYWPRHIIRHDAIGVLSGYGRFFSSPANSEFTSSSI